MAKRFAEPGKKEAPDDAGGSQLWPGLYFLLSMPKRLDGEYSDAGGFSVFCRGGAYQWTVRSPGTNRKMSGISYTLETLLDDIERQLTDGTAQSSILKKSLEAKFQEKQIRIDKH